MRDWQLQVLRFPDLESHFFYKCPGAQMLNVRRPMLLRRAAKAFTFGRADRDGTIMVPLAATWPLGGPR
jgi:hypothetical protein